MQRQLHHRDHIGAFLFDLDGTLVDTEPHTVKAVQQALVARRVDAAEVSLEQVGGRTWLSIAEDLRRRYDLEVAAADLAGELAERWSTRIHHGVCPVPGALEFVREVANTTPVALVTGSDPAHVEYILEQIGLDAALPSKVRICAGAYQRGKPDPEPFLLAARRLGVDISECVVFEDSDPGLRAARQAGATVVFVRHCAAAIDDLETLADIVIDDFTELDSTAWTRP